MIKENIRYFRLPGLFFNLVHDLFAVSFRGILHLLSVVLFATHLLVLAPVLASAYDPSPSVFRFQQKMAERGNAESQFKLGLMYETGSGVEASLVKSILWYKKAADQNHKAAGNRLRYLEVKKNGFKDTDKPWLVELKSDADFNEGEALLLLGQMYAEGTGVNKSLNKSLILLRKAAGGNIAGSEAEIQRVEHELTTLQKQYLKEEEKAKLKYIATQQEPARNRNRNDNNRIITDVQPAQLARPDTKSYKPVALQKKPHSIKQLATEAQNKPPLSASPYTGAITEEAQLKPLTTTETSVDISADINASHPMDIICGGRNRLQQTCR